MNDGEREMWVMNDEGLYNMWKRSRMSKRAFIRGNRVEIDACINKASAPPKGKQWYDYR